MCPLISLPHLESQIRSAGSRSITTTRSAGSNVVAKAGRLKESGEVAAAARP